MFKTMKRKEFCTFLQFSIIKKKVVGQREWSRGGWVCPAYFYPEKIPTENQLTRIAIINLNESI